MSNDVPHPQVGPEHLLGELEAAIMQVVWRRGEVTVREVWAELQPTRPVAYTTVMTVMSRLVPKGVLTARKQGKTYYYQATAQPDEFMAQRAHLAVQDILANFGDLAIVQFLREIDAADPQRLAALYDLVKQERSDAT